MLADLDDTIRQVLVAHVPLDLTEIDVTFDVPTREWSGRLTRPTVNCFLYDLRENHDLRETDWSMERTNGAITMRKAPSRFDTVYQVTAWARAPEDEHRLLWRVLGALARNPILPDEQLQGLLKQQPYPIPAQVAQPERTPRNPGDLWQVLDNQIRLSLTYVVTVALDPNVTFTAPPVLTRRLVMADRPGLPVGESFAIGGTLTDPNDAGRSLAGVHVQLRESGVEVLTDSLGQFRFSRAPAGPVTIVVRAPGQPTEAHQRHVPSPTYDIQLGTGEAVPTSSLLVAETDDTEPVAGDAGSPDASDDSQSRRRRLTRGRRTPRPQDR